MDEEDPPREQTKEEKEDQESHFITKAMGHYYSRKHDMFATHHFLLILFSIL